MAMFYSNGTGVPEDEEEARKWRQRAIELGTKLAGGIDEASD